MPEVQIPWNGSEIAGYLAVPESGSGPGTIVLQEWWGLDDSVRAACDRFAGAGFVALAPDLYGKETTNEPDEAQRMMMNLEMDKVARQMSGAVDLLAGHEAVSGEKVGSMGYCLGGGLSIWAASVNEKVGAAVSFYGVFPHGKPDFSAIKAPVQGHFGLADDFIPEERRSRPRAGAEGRRRGRRVLLLRGLRPRIRQREQPDRDGQRGSQGTGLVPHDRLLPRQPGRRLTTSSSSSCSPSLPRGVS